MTQRDEHEANDSSPLVIHALHVGDIVDWPSAATLHMRRFGERRDLPLIMFVITGGEHPVVVDTGGGTPEQVARVHGYTIRQSPEQRPERAIADLGIDADDVRVVVNSHLHWDHSANNDLFPRARIVVQRTELQYAIDPEQPHRKAYERLGDTTPSWIRDLGRFDVVDGDDRIADGIEVVLLPGHSPGSQGVLVDTAAGPHLIAGDCVGTYESWAGDDQVDHLPSGTFTSVHDYMQSFRRIEQLDCTVIPSHDPAVVEARRFPASPTSEGGHRG